ncbi:hypothetical protein L198_02150 [Cryptococcus wingfieldii CBS 7118]|uniref:Uncharacterized protein n=1 Tax=Cryptococcus wingfieldii CBS 7118 TaxID=1295528 RepID=A0A1E3JZ18_9TREE|nr:hypothetical protein L198_02150 [Cryptococcus wingfieldii CBS 7118]ODO05457.1 hypothetical protein L198_02150 [Cryptococcus wingfieldii CBS 7118]
MPPSTANNPSQSGSFQTIVYVGLKKYYDFILFWTSIVAYTLTIVVLATLDSSTCPVPRLQMSADGARLGVNFIVYCFFMPSPPGRSSQQGGQQPLVLGMTRLQQIKIASAVIFTVFGFAALMLQIAHTASVERHEACLSAILCPDSFDKPPCTGVQGQFCRNPSVNPAQALIKDNIRAETIDGGYRFDFDADTLSRTARATSSLLAVATGPTSRSLMCKLFLLSVWSPQQANHFSPFPQSSFNIIVSPVLLLPHLLAPAIHYVVSSPCTSSHQQTQTIPDSTVTPPAYSSTIILPKSSLPAANKTRFQVPVEAAFNCSSSEKLSLGVVVRIAETEKAKELERGDRVRLEEKKGLTRIAGEGKGDW